MVTALLVGMSSGFIQYFSLLSFRPNSKFPVPSCHSQATKKREIDFIGKEWECHTESKGREATDFHGTEPQNEDLQDIQEVLLLLISWFCCCSLGSLLSCLTVHWLPLVLAELTENVVVVQSLSQIRPFATP